MNTSKFQLKKGLFFTLCALGASALMSSCSNEDIQAAAGGSQDEDRVPVELQASVIGAQIAGTRATDVNNNAFQTPFQDFDIFINNGTAGASEWTTLLYDMQTAGTLIAPASPHYFPSGVYEVSVYGWYPSTNAAKTFSVQDDQNSDDNYVMSDLMYAMPKNCTRELKNGSWVVNPAELEFQHVMSKLKVSVTPTTGITVESVKLLQAHKAYSINVDNPSSPSFTVDKQTADITLKSSGFTAGTAFDCYGVIPAQTIAASTDFIEVKAKNAAGTAVSVKFRFQNQSTLEQGKIYTLNLTLGQIRSDATATISNWNSATGKVEVTVGPLEDPAAMSTTAADIKKNALFWVAEYNLATIKDATDNTLAVPGPATETTFCTEHSVLKGHVNVFAWSDVVNNLTGDGKTPFTIGSYSYYVPSYAEQISVIPSDNDAGNGMNIFAQSGTIKNPTVIKEKNCSIAGAQVTGDSSYIAKFGNLDYYMVRFGKTDYASAWHYKQIPGSGLIIESYVLKNKCKNKEDAQKVLAALPYTEAWGGNANTTPAIADPSSNSVVRRFLPACGYAGGAGLATYNVGTYGIYWSSSEVTAGGQTAFRWSFNSNGLLFEYTHAKTFGFSVRPFRSHN